MKNWRRYAKSIVAGVLAAAAAINTALAAHTGTLGIVIAAVLAVGTVFGVYQTSNAP